jgi:hypothetical protein
MVLGLIVSPGIKNTCGKIVGHLNKQIAKTSQKNSYEDRLWSGAGRRALDKLVLNKGPQEKRSQAL